MDNRSRNGRDPAQGAHTAGGYTILERVRVHCSVLRRAIVRATNRPTGGKDGRRLLAATISPIICAFNQLHHQPQWFSFLITDLIRPPADPPRYYYFEAVARTLRGTYSQAFSLVRRFFLSEMNLRIELRLWICFRSKFVGDHRVYGEYVYFYLYFYLSAWLNLIVFFFFQKRCFICWGLDIEGKMLVSRK